MTILAAPWLAAVAQVAQPAPDPVTVVVPDDWSRLPPLPWRVAPELTPDVAKVVGDEMARGKCRVQPETLEISMAVLVRGDGTVRAIVPRAINCPEVEQFAAGLVTRYARNNLRLPAAGWYRTSLPLDRR